MTIPPTVMHESPPLYRCLVLVCLFSKTSEQMYMKSNPLVSLTFTSRLTKLQVMWLSNWLLTGLLLIWNEFKSSFSYSIWNQKKLEGCASDRFLTSWRLETAFAWLKATRVMLYTLTTAHQQSFKLSHSSHGNRTNNQTKKKCRNEIQRTVGSENILFSLLFWWPLFNSNFDCNRQLIQLTSNSSVSIVQFPFVVILKLLEIFCGSYHCCMYIAFVLRS